MESGEKNLLILYREQQLVQPSVVLWLCTSHYIHCEVSLQNIKDASFQSRLYFINFVLFLHTAVFERKPEFEVEK